MDYTLIIALLACFIMGVSKAGLKGLGLIVVALLAISYGARASTGILLPLLSVADFLAVWYYKRNVKWKYLYKFLPATALGVLIAVVVGKDLNEQAFKYGMGIIILISVGIMLYRERLESKEFPDTWSFALLVGIATGFTTMIGNMAGAFAILFFLATRLPKNDIIGTSAWLFLIINLFKLPFHIWVWETINLDTIKIDLMLVPAVFVGFYVGLKLVHLFNEKAYRNFLLIVTTISALLIFIK